jgi:hypothetical protein
MDIKRFCFFMILVASVIGCSETNAQYRWDFSKNYDSLRNDKNYSFCYKIESVYHPTQIFYEMRENGRLKEEVLFRNVDYNDNPIYPGVLHINIDGHDTLVFTDTLGDANICLPCTAQDIKISISAKPSGFYIPISNLHFPSSIKIVWGSVDDRPSILTLYSKVPLEDKELTEISNSLFLGSSIDSDLFYYYFSDE